MRFSATFASLALCLSTVPAALAVQPGNEPALVARQNDEDSTTTSSTGSATITNPPSASGTHTSASNTADNEDETRSNDNEDETSSGTSRRSGTSSGSRTYTQTRFPQNSPNGGVSLTEPLTIIEPTPLYRISDHVTFGWNYTSLLAPPSAVDVLVSCATASATWTLASNMSFETSVDFVWDTEKQANDVEQPLLVELYTLIVKDANMDITEAADPGYLAAYTGFTFGLYTGIPYTPYPEWTCPGECSAGMSLINRQAIGFALTMCVVTVLSFTFFVAGLP